VDPLGDQALGFGRGEIGEQDEDRGDSQQTEREQHDLAVRSASAGARAALGGTRLDGRRLVDHRREPTIGGAHRTFGPFDRTVVLIHDS
jgi:hypothetical protein